MLAEYKTKTNIYVGLGILGQIAARFIISGAGESTPKLMLGLVLLIAAIVSFIAGCCFYAKGKGYSGALGLLGLLSCIGLIILVLLPDKHR